MARGLRGDREAAGLRSGRRKMVRRVYRAGGSRTLTVSIPPGLGIEEGDYLQWSVEGGKIVLEKVDPPEPMKVVTVKVDEALLSGIEELVERGRYKSRSEAIRKAVAGFLERRASASAHAQLPSPEPKPPCPDEDQRQRDRGCGLAKRRGATT